MKRREDSNSQTVARNRKAFHDYDVLERFEAGVALQGTEVKSARQHQVTLTGGHVRIEHGEARLCGVRIAPYDHGNQFNHEPDRQRRLLLHKREIHHLLGMLSQKGYTLVPLSAYFRRGKLKFELGVCRGRQASDKRQAMRRADDDREARRAIRRHVR